jgi:hypothetical protein
MRRLLATRTNFAASLSRALGATTFTLVATLLALAPARALPTGLLHAAICDAEDVLARPSSELLHADISCLMSQKPADELAEARVYLVETASPGYTMTRQGPQLAIERLHPEFAVRLAGALREARESGLRDAGIFSAYRPPAFGIGGFSDKFNSLHSYGLAVDLAGIGSPGSSEAKRWHEIAARHGVACPYGPNNGAEWNHCQPTSLKVIHADNPLRETITAAGPVSLEGMFEAGNAVVESAADIAGAVDKDPPVRATVQASVVVKAKRRPPRDRDDDDDDGKDKDKGRDRDKDEHKHKRDGRVAERRAADKDL